MLVETGGKITVEKTATGKNTGKVTIVSVSNDDAGTYSCACFNGNEYKTFTKNVHIVEEKTPITIVSQKLGHGLVGSTVSVSCEANGTPRPNIDWYTTDAKKVVPGNFPANNFHIEYTLSMTKSISNLVVRNGLHTDSDTFLCKAWYSVGGEESSETSESEMVIAIPTSPRIVCLDNVVEENTVATLVCGFSGVPEPTLTYGKFNETDDSVIELSESYGYQNNLSYFLIPKVKKLDAGVYKVIASNVDNGGLQPRFDLLKLTVIDAPSRLSMNSVISIAVAIAFILLGGLILIIILGRWKRETNFRKEMKRLIKEHDREVSDMQKKLQLRSMEHTAHSIGNPLYQLPETRRHLPSFYAANIAALTTTPSVKPLPPSLVDYKKSRLTGKLSSATKIFSC